MKLDEGKLKDLGDIKAYDQNILSEQKKKSKRKNEKQEGKSQ